ncbi:hypothetical protein V8G54_015545 [Vigna mungo]|uniref:FBD domain-containing protein n=1 Tax=Vigna mungo TaxID=3915 RepID=A0AAQ3NJM4_VIGMU
MSYVTVEDTSFVDLSLLKILHLKSIISPKIDLSLLLYGCPNLEVLKVRRLDCETKGKFIILPKLVRVSIDGPLLSLETFKDVEVLKFDYVMPIFQPNLDLNFDFQNLVQLQLEVALDWLLVLKVLNHCPKLQSLVINIYKTLVRYYQTLNLPGYEEDVWPYPPIVPACISSHLKTFRLKDYSGSKDEFHFVRYMLENAKYLQTMKIRFDCGYVTMGTMKIRTLSQENDMKRELYSIKRSYTCTLSFE